MAKWLILFYWAAIAAAGCIEPPTPAEPGVDPSRAPMSKASQMDTELDRVANDLASYLAELTAESGNQRRVKVAVLPFSDLHDTKSIFGKRIAEELTTRLGKTRDRFHLIERTLLGHVFKEQGLEQGAAFDERTVIQLGKQLGVMAICSGTVSCEGGQTYRINARLINVETNLVLGTSQATLENAAPPDEPQPHQEHSPVIADVPPKSVDAPPTAEDTPRDMNDRPMRLTIDKQTFGQYPAAVVSLDQGRVLPAPGKPGRKAPPTQVNADLWIEPNDPEIAALTSEIKEIAHVGQDVALAVLEGVDFDGLRAAPAQADWTDRVPKAEIRLGTVFLVRSSSGKLYKLRIEVFSEKEQRLDLVYAPL